MEADLFMTFMYRSQVTTWDASHGDQIRRHTFGDIVKSDDVLLSWLLGALNSHVFTVVTFARD